MPNFDPVKRYNLCHKISDDCVKSNPKLTQEQATIFAENMVSMLENLASKLETNAAQVSILEQDLAIARQAGDFSREKALVQQISELVILPKNEKTQMFVSSQQQRELIAETRAEIIQMSDASLVSVSPNRSGNVSLWSGYPAKAAAHSKGDTELSKCVPIANVMGKSWGDVIGHVGFGANFLLWHAMSQDYAHNTTLNTEKEQYVVNYYNAYPEIGSSSIFWNTELHQLQEKAQQGDDTLKIVYHSLNDEALERYKPLQTELQSLLEQKKAVQNKINTIKKFDPGNNSKLEQAEKQLSKLDCEIKQINIHIAIIEKNPNCWCKRTPNEIKITEAAGKSNTESISAGRMKSFAQKMRAGQNSAIKPTFQDIVKEAMSCKSELQQIKGDKIEQLSEVRMGMSKA